MARTILPLMRLSLRFPSTDQGVRLALTPDDKPLHTADGVLNDVAVIDVPSVKALKSIFLGSCPRLAIAKR